MMRAKELNERENLLLENGERKAINYYGKKIIQSTIKESIQVNELHNLKRCWRADKNDLYNACVKLRWFNITLSQCIKNFIMRVLNVD
jgi:hypothetical protein